MFNLKGNIKLIVLIGYIVLFLLSVVGLVRIYQELIKFSQFKNPYEERKELNIVSNALVALYEAESVRKVLLSEEFYTPGLSSDIDRLDLKIRTYIDSLHSVSTDDKVKESLDTVTSLLNDKKRNLSGMIALMDSIRKLPQSSFFTTKLLTHREVADLSNISKDKSIQSNDTSYYIKEQRTFLDRVRAVFTSKEDSTKVVTKAGTIVTDSLIKPENKILTDTLVQYVNAHNLADDKRKAAFVSKLASRQSTMLYYDEQLSGQINTILRRIEDDERQVSEQLRIEKEAVLARSSKSVSRIGMASLFTLILFLYFTMILLNGNQKYREQLEKSNSLSQNLLKSRERLLLMISHDVKAPLSSIIGHIEFMYNDKLAAEDKEHLESMRNSSEQILDLSNRLLHFHKLEKGVAELRVVPFSPHSVMNDIYNSFIPAASKKNLTIESENNIDPSLICVCDPFILTQIINNLTNNAIKFTNKGGVFLKSSIDNANSILNVTVKDTGVGISDDEKERIFEEFGRAGSLEAQQNTDGFGLGLPITVKLVSVLNGNLSFNSKSGEGTEFFLSIPIEKAVDAVEHDQQVEKQAEIEKLPLKLLWVEDDESLLNLYSKVLERKGAAVTKCHDSMDALELIQNNHFDLIISDIQMPKMNGFQLVKNIRALGGRFSEIPFIALSARTDLSEKDFKAAGFTSFLPKPLSFDKLYQVISHLNNSNVTEIEEEIQLNEDYSKGFYSLIEYVKNDKEVSLDILNTFLEDNKEKTDALKRAAADADWDAVKFVSHKMMPLMTMIGVDETVSALTKLEAGEKDADLVKNLIPLIEDINLKAADFIDEFSKS